jgi:hypothetical protein
MPPPTPIIVDVPHGEIVLGSRRVRLVPTDNPNRFLVHGVDVRAVTFAERSAAVREAIVADEPPAALVAALRDRAVTGDADLVVDAVVLALAGGASEAPAYEVCAVDVARRCGWSWQALADATALDVDRLAASPAPVVAGDGWSRVIIAPPERDELEALVREMAERLVARGIAGAEAAASARLSDPAVDAAATGRSAGGDSETGGMAADAGGHQAAGAPMLGGGPASPVPSSRPGPAPSNAPHAWPMPDDPSPGASAVESCRSVAVDGNPFAGAAPPGNSHVMPWPAPTGEMAGVGPGTLGVPSPGVAGAGWDAWPATSFPHAVWTRDRDALIGPGPRWPPPLAAATADVPWPGLAVPGSAAAGWLAGEASSPGTTSFVGGVRTAAATDLLDDLARALADECDLRGLDA